MTYGLFIRIGKLFGFIMKQRQRSNLISRRVTLKIINRQRTDQPTRQPLETLDLLRPEGDEGDVDDEDEERDEANEDDEGDEDDENNEDDEDTEDDEDDEDDEDTEDDEDDEDDADDEDEDKDEDEEDEGEDTSKHVHGGNRPYSRRFQNI